MSLGVSGTYSSKEMLSSLMRDHVLTDALLYTLLTEVENIVNRQPLTHISDDVDDFGVLTQNHILLVLHYRKYVCEVKDHEVASRGKFRQVQAIVNQL